MVDADNHFHHVYDNTIDRTRPPTEIEVAIMVNITKYYAIFLEKLPEMQSYSKEQILNIFWKNHAKMVKENKHLIMVYGDKVDE